MESEIAKTSLQIPLMSCWKLGKFWTGFLRINEKLLRLSVSAPHFPCIRELKLDGDEELKAICDRARVDFEKLVQKNVTLSEFMAQFQARVKELMGDQAGGVNQELLSAVMNPEFYSGLLEEFDQIGHEKISFVANNYCEIHVTHLDAASREHVIRFFLSTRYPYASLKVVVDLPCDLDSIKWPSKISDASNQFVSELTKYNDFWNEMELLDQARVIDPARPNFGHTYRRILLDEKIVLHLTMKPLQPRAYPEVQITGPEQPVGDLHVLLEANLHGWNESISLLNNLQNVLQIQFPPKICIDEANEGTEDTELNCTICYMYDLEGEVPERTCMCSASFHNRCLYDLYVSDFLGTGKKYVDCPVCSEELKIMVTYG